MTTTRIPSSCPIVRTTSAMPRGCTPFSALHCVVWQSLVVQETLSSSEEGTTSGSITRQSIESLSNAAGWKSGGSRGPGRTRGRPQLLRGPFTDADVESLPLAYDVRERLHGFFKRRFEIVAVRLVEVDVVGSQSGQGTVDGLKDVFTGESDIVVSLGAGGTKDLGEDLQRLAAFAGERVAEDRLGQGVGVDVSRVERADPRVQGCTDALGGDVVLDLGTMGEPVTVGDLRDLQTTVAQVSIFHDRPFLSAKGSFVFARYFGGASIEALVVEQRTASAPICLLYT